MRILVIGDTHCRTKYLSEYAVNSASILSKALELKPDCIVMLGDDLHNHSTTHSSQLTAVTDFIIGLSKIAPVFKLIGNHEMVSPNSFMLEDHHFNSMKHIDNITIIDKPIVIDGIFLSPYVPKGKFKSVLEGVDLSSVNVCFAHQEFRGVKVGNQESTSDDVWKSGRPLMISGHIHDKQAISTNLVYIGSPAQFTFADADDKTIALVDNGFVEYIDVDYVHYKTFVIESKETVDYSNKDRNRIIVSGTLSELKTFRSSSFFKKAQKDGVHIVPKVKDDISVSGQRRDRKTFTEIINGMLSEDARALWEAIR